MQFNPYGGPAAELAAALVNRAPTSTTADIRRTILEHWTDEPEFTDAQAEHLRRWAARLRPVFGADSTSDAVDLVNRLLAATASRPYVSCHDGRPPHLHFAHERDDIVRRVRAFTAAGLAMVICEERQRLGRCAREGCTVVYVDTSRNGRRRFCSTGCASRVHVADHRRRLAAGPSPR